MGVIYKLTAVLIALASVLACAMAGASPASAALQVTIRPVTSETATFRGLSIEDVSGGDDQVLVTRSSYYDGSGGGGFVDELAFASPSGFIHPLPPGCYVPAEGNVIADDEVPAFACENGTVDLVGIFTGAGRDRVSGSGYWTYPDLTLKQISSPDIPVYMNVFLGPGRDKFVSGPGTDAVHGESGRDRIRGDTGHDLLLGGAGADSLHGDSSTDIMGGGPGRDKCFGSGKDRVRSCERIRFEEG